MKKDDKSKFKYEIVKDGKIEKIKKTGEFVIDFTLEEIVLAINSYNRSCTESMAEIEVRNALIDGFKRDNKKFVKYFTDQNVDLINEFCVAWIEKRDREELLEKNRLKIKDLEAELLEIEKQTGLKPKIPTIKYEKASNKQDGE